MTKALLLVACVYLLSGFALTVAAAQDLAQIRQAQQQLKNAGFDPGPMDGMLGLQTKAALRQYQAAHGLPETGVLDEATRKALGLSTRTAADTGMRRPAPAGEPPQGGGRATAPFAPLYRRTWAVIIGIDEYPNLEPTGQLQYAVRDAQGVERLLRRAFRFDEIITLYNAQATGERIRQTLLGALSATDREDGVFVFYAGHALTQGTRYGPRGYLVPYDGSFKPAEIYRNISMTSLKEEISKAIPAKHILYAVDACFSGLLLATRGVEQRAGTRLREPAYLERITRQEVRQVLTAGGQGEKVLDGGKGGHSVFTGQFLALLEEARDYITGRELGLRLPRQVFAAAQERKHEQLPQFGHLLGEGDFVFIKRGPEAPPAPRPQVGQLEPSEEPGGWEEQTIKKVVTDVFAMWEFKDFSRFPALAYSTVALEDMATALKQSPVRVRQGTIVDMRRTGPRKATVAVQYEYTDPASITAGAVLSARLRRLAAEPPALDPPPSVPDIMPPSKYGIETFAVGQETFQVIKPDKTWLMDLREAKGILWYAAHAGGYDKEQREQLTRILGDDDLTRMTAMITFLALDLNLSQDEMAALVPVAGEKVEQAMRQLRKLVDLTKEYQKR
jgi:peptidoglycan hydrolase-like protein with peptidoglycan-binding domain